MVACFSVLGLNCGNQETEIAEQVNTPPPDRAQVVADQAMEAMGGKENWDK